MLRLYYKIVDGLAAITAVLAAWVIVNTPHKPQIHDIENLGEIFDMSMKASQGHYEKERTDETK